MYVFICESNNGSRQTPTMTYATRTHTPRARTLCTTLYEALFLPAVCTRRAYPSIHYRTAYTPYARTNINLFVFLENFFPRRYSQVQSIRPKMDFKAGWFAELGPMWPGQAMCLEVESVLYDQRSEYQHIVVLQYVFTKIADIYIISP